MKKKRVLSILLSAVVAVSMCFAGAGTVFADTEEGLIGSEQIETEVSTIPDGITDVMSVKKGAGPAEAIPLKGAGDAIEVPINTETALTGDTTKFNVKVPAAGYLTMTIIGYASSYDGYTSLYAKTKGFKDFVYFSESDNNKVIGVKKGTYTFTVKNNNSNADFILVKPAFKKVKEAKYGTTAASAGSIKKLQVKKGLMITAGQKPHIYKFVNTRDQKVKLKVNSKLTSTGSYGGIKIIFYSGSQKLTNTIYDGSRATTISYYTFGLSNQKLKKGTYYFKVQPYKKATGFFKLKLK